MMLELFKSIRHVSGKLTEPASFDLQCVFIIPFLGSFVFSKLV